MTNAFGKIWLTTTPCLDESSICLNRADGHLYLPWITIIIISY
ncbi:MAG TPA: hypothetical protein ACHBX6_09445 [Arsenophonus nasoniae]